MNSLKVMEQFQESPNYEQASDERELKLVTLERQATKLDDVADILTKLALRLRGNGLADSDGPLRTTLLDQANALYKGRAAARDVFEDQSLVTGPAWEILLDLFISGEMGRQVTITDATIAAGCPATTGLRWVHVLCDYKLIEKSRDQRDQRRTFLNLTQLGKEKIEQALRCYLFSDI